MKITVEMTTNGAVLSFKEGKITEKKYISLKRQNLKDYEIYFMI